MLCDIFFSPGTFVSEQTSMPIDSYDVDKAVKMSRGIIERYNAKPYGFCFTTRERKEDELDSRETHRTGMYYLGEKIETHAEVEARNDPREEILRDNMRSNGFTRIITGNNGWRWTQPFREEDILLDVELALVKAGS